MNKYLFLCLCVFLVISCGGDRSNDKFRNFLGFQYPYTVTMKITYVTPFFTKDSSASELNREVICEDLFKDFFYLSELLGNDDRLIEGEGNYELCRHVSELIYCGYEGGYLDYSFYNGEKITIISPYDPEDILEVDPEKMITEFKVSDEKRTKHLAWYISNKWVKRY